MLVALLRERLSPLSEILVCFRFPHPAWSDVEEGLRYAKKGLKIKNATPFVHHMLSSNAVEIAANLAASRSRR